jgi:hypothetical protein
LSGGAVGGIVGGIVGGFLLAVVGGALYVVFGRNRRKSTSQTQRVELDRIVPDKTIESSRTGGVTSAEIEQN